MKRLFLFFLFFIIASSIVLGAQEGVVSSGLRQDNRTITGMPGIPSHNTTINANTPRPAEPPAIRNKRVIKMLNDSSIQVIGGNLSLHIGMAIMQKQVQNRTRVEAKLRNGGSTEIRIMPDTASNTALHRLGAKKCSDKNCHIELKEAVFGKQTRAIYEIRAQKEVKISGFIKANMPVKAQIDAENGTVIKTEQSWWAFLASK